LQPRALDTIHLSVDLDEAIAETRTLAERT
jgi:hypothetical protein